MYIYLHVNPIKTNLYSIRASPDIGKVLFHIELVLHNKLVS